MSVPSIYMVGSRVIGGVGGIFAQVSAGIGSAPLILFTDIVSGSRVNGENGKGCYLSIFGLNLGTQANMGTSAGAKVFIGGVEIDNYRGLDISVVNGVRPGFPSIQRLVTQIGALAGLSDGTSYAISVVVNGLASNPNDPARGNPLVFTPNPGHFFFVDTVSGSDSTGVRDDITHPYRYIQHYSGSSPVSPSVFASIQPGDTVVIRGNGGTPITDQVGFDNRLMRFAANGGNVPTGSSGTGYIHFTAYPGSGGSGVEDVYVLTPNGGEGGFMGTDTVHARPNANWGQYWTCSNMRSSCQGTLGSTDASNFNLQNSADFTRFVNLDVQWPSTDTGSAHQKAGGVVGNGHFVSVFGCNIHNIAGGDPSSLENHGIYFDGSNTCAQNVEIGYCTMINCTTGQNLQFHNQDASDFFLNIYIHHCWAEVSGKYGFKFDSWGGQIWGWNCVINHSQREGLQLDGSGASTADLHFENLTFWDCYHDTGGYLAIIANEGAPISGTCQVANCILAFPSGRTNTSVDFIGDAVGVTPSGNVYFDYAGVLTSKPSSDTAGIYASPLFTSPVVAPNSNLELQSTSNALNRAITATIDPGNDLSMNVQPRAGKSDESCGAFA